MNLEYINSVIDCNDMNTLFEIRLGQEKWYIIKPYVTKLNSKPILSGLAISGQVDFYIDDIDMFVAYRNDKFDIGVLE